jgi:hypothetical protein
MTYYYEDDDIVTWVVKLFRVYIAYDIIMMIFQHVNFIFLTKIHFIFFWGLFDDETSLKLPK